MVDNTMKVVDETINNKYLQISLIILAVFFSKPLGKFIPKPVVQVTNHLIMKIAINSLIFHLAFKHFNLAVIVTCFYMLILQARKQENMDNTGACSMTPNVLGVCTDISCLNPLDRTNCCTTHTVLPKSSSDKAVNKCFKMCQNFKDEGSCTKSINCTWDTSDPDNAKCRSKCGYNLGANNTKCDSAMCETVKNPFNAKNNKTSCVEKCEINKTQNDCLQFKDHHCIWNTEDNKCYTSCDWTLDSNLSTCNNTPGCMTKNLGSDNAKCVTDCANIKNLASNDVNKQRCKNAYNCKVENDICTPRCMTYQTETECNDGDNCNWDKGNGKCIDNTAN